MFTIVIPLFVWFWVSKSLIYAGAENGNMDDIAGQILTCILAILVGAFAAFLVKKNIWIRVGLAGIGAGMAFGAVTFALAVNAGKG